MKQPTAEEMLELIQKLPDAGEHHHYDDGKYYVTNEFFAGAFAGRAFAGNTYEEAAEKLIDYMYEHIGHDSIVGRAVTDGFPDLNRVYQYCLESHDILITQSFTQDDIEA